MKALIGFLILAAGVSTHAAGFGTFAVKDVAAIQQQVDGTYNVYCVNGTQEVVTASDLAIENVCPYVKPGVPACIKSIIKLPGDVFEAICQDGTYARGSAEDVKQGRVCPCPIPTPPPTPAPTPIPPSTVDIVMVIDDSGSMSGHQSNLSANASSFVSNLGALQTADWHIGVLTTDSSEAGRLFGATRFVTPATPAADSILAANMKPGTNGSDYERHFNSLVAGLSEPNLSGYNTGFYRNDAHLAVIFITDVDDQSVNTVQQTADFLVDLKKSAGTKVLTYGILAASALNPRCARESSAEPVRLFQLIELFQGASYDLCAPDWGKKLEVIAKDITVKLGLL